MKSKVYEDVYGDTIEVSQFICEGVIALETSDGGYVCRIHLDPKAARKFAKRVLKMANEMLEDCDGEMLQ